MAAISSPSATLRAHYLPVRQAWLDRRKEPILDVNLPIVDPHHHIWDREGWRYLLDDLLGDTNSGHNIVATVFVQARSMYGATGPEEIRPVGEVEFANGVAAMSASGIYGKTKICAAIVGHADLTLGARVEPGRRFYVPEATVSAASATSPPGTRMHLHSIRPTARSADS
jgi:L-fuconolactonase